jgi:uncharacterized protein
MKERLPLFLLDTVLFPHMQLPLQVFEPRYLEMVRRCLQEESVFGVNLIRSGEEVGGTADPMEVGTTARILTARSTEDGRILLATRGERRYRIVATDRTRAYLQAEVEYLEDALEASALPLSRRVFGRFREVLEEMGLAVEFDEELFEQPERISYLVAAHINRGNPDKQRLLEIDSVRRRLELEERWVEEVLETVRARKKVEETAGRNGRVHRQG